MPEEHRAPTPLTALLHSPLVGPSTWQPVAQQLRAEGLPVSVPPVTVVPSGSEPLFGRTAEAAAAEIDRAADLAAGGGGSGVVLVGHSGAGPLLPSVADAMRTAVVGTVFVDAGLPHPGSSWFGHVPAEVCRQLRGLAVDGMLPPWDEWFPPGTLEELLPDTDSRARFRAELPRLPLSWFEEAVPGVPDAPGGIAGLPERNAYLRLSAPYETAAAQAAQEGWRVVRRDTHHLAVFTDPAGAAAVLRELTGEFVRG